TSPRQAQAAYRRLSVCAGGQAAGFGIELLSPWETVSSSKGTLRSMLSGRPKDLLGAKGGPPRAKRFPRTGNAGQMADTQRVALGKQPGCPESGDGDCEGDHPRGNLALDQRHVQLCGDGRGKPANLGRPRAPGPRSARGRLPEAKRSGRD